MHTSVYLLHNSVTLFHNYQQTPVLRPSSAFGPIFQPNLSGPIPIIFDAIFTRTLFECPIRDMRPRLHCGESEQVLRLHFHHLLCAFPAHMLYLQIPICRVLVALPRHYHHYHSFG